MLKHCCTKTSLPSKAGLAILLLAIDGSNGLKSGNYFNLCLAYNLGSGSLNFDKIVCSPVKLQVYIFAESMEKFLY